MYVFAGGDPVNGRDPTGTIVVLMHGIQSRGEWSMEMSRGLTSGWQKNGADVTQDVVKRVNERTPGKEFNERNALRASRKQLERETMQAGERTAELLIKLPGHLDNSKFHRNEPINLIAHSHGSAIILAAARARQTELRLDNVILAGSDLHPDTDLSALTNVARQVVSYSSTEDDTTGAIGAAGGGAGFNSKAITQRNIAAVDHWRGRRGERRGQLAWMTGELSERYFAQDTATQGEPQRERLLKEDWPWTREYISLRKQLGGGYGQVPLP